MNRDFFSKTIRLALFLCVFICVVISLISSVSQLFEYEGFADDICIPVAINSDDVYTQIIKHITNDCITEIGIRFGTYNRVNNGLVKVSLFSNDNLVQTWEINSGLLTDNSYQFFKLNKPLYAKNNDTISFQLSYSYSGDDNKIAVYLSNGGELYLNGSVQMRNICHKTKKYDLSMQKRYLFALICAYLLFWAAFILLVKWQNYSYSQIVLFCLIQLIFFVTFHVTLLDKIKTESILHDVKPSGSYDVIHPNQAGTYVLKHNGADISYLEFYMPSKSKSESVEVQIIKGADGQVLNEMYFDSTDLVCSDVSNKTIRMDMSNISFPPHEYNINIKNIDNCNDLFIAAKDGSIEYRSTRRSYIGYWILYMVLCLLSVMIIAILALQSRNKLEPSSFFLCAVVPLSLIYFVLILPWSPPDTRAHYLAIYRYSNNLLGLDESLEWTARPSDADFYFSSWKKNPNMEGYIMIDSYSDDHDISGYTSIDAFDHMKYYSIINYLPQVLGIAIGRIIHLGPVYTLYMGRLMILVFYILCSHHFIKITPVGKNIFAMIPLFPMCMMMSSSLSYDAMVIISTLGFTANILRLCLVKTDKRYLIETAIWSFVIGAVKGGGFLIFLPLTICIVATYKKNGIKRALVPIISGLSSVILFDVLLPKSTLFQFGGADPDKLSFSLMYKEPIRFIGMTVEAYIVRADSLFINMGGYLLNWLEATIPCVFIMALMMIIFICSVIEPDERSLPRIYSPIMSSVIILSIIFTPAMLLSWTQKDSIFIAGLQGRYYLPVLVLGYLIFTKYGMKDYITFAKKSASVVLNKLYVVYTGISSICVIYMLRLFLSR